MVKVIKRNSNGIFSFNDVQVDGKLENQKFLGEGTAYRMVNVNETYYGLYFLPESKVVSHVHNFDIVREIPTYLSVDLLPLVTDSIYGDVLFTHIDEKTNLDEKDLAIIQSNLTNNRLMEF